MWSLLRGAAAGAVATGFMSALMVAARRAGLMGTMPPEKITASFLDRAGIHRSRREQDALATAFHFAFGAGGGALYSLTLRRAPLPAILKGLAFGSAIWGVSYMGWVPALGIMPPADRDRPDRQLSMLLGHLVYGAALATILTRR